VILLDVPEEHYDENNERWQALGFYPTQRTTYHKIDLPTSYDEWFSRPGVRRQNIRRAREGGLTVAFGGKEMLESFYELYLGSFARWQSRQVATHAHDYVRFQRLFDVPGSQVQLAAVKFEDRIAAAAIFCCYSRTAGYLYSGTNFEYQQLRPNNLLHAEIIRYLIERGVSEYNLGNSLNLKDLEHFKESLGADRHLSVTLCRERFPRLKRLLHKGSAHWRVPKSPDFASF
jgi:lipid II:glycine glycyltransferase (peptidoglycan interpeptide bridge formation enzyme)